LLDLALTDVFTLLPRCWLQLPQTTSAPHHRCMQQRSSCSQIAWRALTSLSPTR
jgi:hypothetical protein